MCFQFAGLKDPKKVNSLPVFLKNLFLFILYGTKYHINSRMISTAISVSPLFRIFLTAGPANMLRRPDQITASSTKFRINRAVETQSMGWMLPASFLQIFTMQ